MVHIMKDTFIEAVYKSSRSVFRINETRILNGMGELLDQEIKTWAKAKDLCIAVMITNSAQRNQIMRGERIINLSAPVRSLQAIYPWFQAQAF